MNHVNVIELHYTTCNLYRIQSVRTIPRIDDGIGRLTLFTMFTLDLMVFGIES